MQSRHQSVLGRPLTGVGQPRHHNRLRLRAKATPSGLPLLQEPVKRSKARRVVSPPRRRPRRNRGAPRALLDEPNRPAPWRRAWMHQTRPRMPIRKRQLSSSCAERVDHLAMSMGTDPKKSVVDRHCRAHDHQNLFILGGSVFPIGLRQIRHCVRRKRSR
jgi:choline dehydrogenase-like flavoprotein